MQWQGIGLLPGHPHHPQDHPSSGYHPAGGGQMDRIGGTTPRRDPDHPIKWDKWTYHGITLDRVDTVAGARWWRGHVGVLTLRSGRRRSGACNSKISNLKITQFQGDFDNPLTGTGGTVISNNSL